MASFQNTDPLLGERLIKLAEIYQALLSGCVSCPESLIVLIEELMKNRSLAGEKNDTNWLLYVDAVQQMATGLWIGDYMQSRLDDIMIPPHLLEKAYSWYRKYVTKMCFKAWRQYFSTKRAMAARTAMEMSIAAQHHTHGMLWIALHRWAAWLRVRRKRQQEAVKKLMRIRNAVYCKKAFQAWRYVMQDVKRAKERFEIFQYLSIGDLARCAQVCHAWKALTQSSALWSQVNLTTEKRCDVDSAVALILQKHRPFVVHLNMRGCAAVQQPTFLYVAKCRNLQDLNLSECKSITVSDASVRVFWNVADETMRVIVEGCPTLLYLNLSHTAVTDATLRTLSSCCLTLQYLSLAYCQRFTDRGLQYLATGEGCHRLVHLELSGCTQICVDGFEYVATGCSLLQHVELNDMPTLSDRCVLAMVSKCCSLTRVSLLDTPHLSDTAFRAIAESCRLQRISVEGNSHVTDVSWRAICKNSPNLNRIHAVDCPRLSDMTVRSIGTLRNLTSLCIAGCVRVSDTGMRHLLEGPSASKLHQLNLTNCSRVGDVTLLRLAQRCSSLRDLRLSFCKRITDSGLECLGGLPSLTSLDLTGTNIQDQGLTSLGSSPSLKKLSLSKCLGITDSGIEKLCEEMRDLESMDLSHCLSLSDQTVKALSFHCRGLVTLRIRGCPKMTDVAMQYLTAVSRYLRELDVSGCIHLTDRTAKLLYRGCHRLGSITMLYCKGISRQTALMLQPRAQHWVHSQDKVPTWYGYDRQGRLLQPTEGPATPKGQWEMEEEERSDGYQGNHNKASPAD